MRLSTLLAVAVALIAPLAAGGAEAARLGARARRGALNPPGALSEEMGPERFAFSELADGGAPAGAARFLEQKPTRVENGPTTLSNTNRASRSGKGKDSTTSTGTTTSGVNKHGVHTIVVQNTNTHNQH